LRVSKVEMAVPTEDLPSVGFEQHDAVVGDQERD